jgi:sugar (pentulose or hexulose) kinase
MLLGLDVGTSAVKAAVLDRDLREVGHGRAPTPWRRVPTGAELSPDELLEAALAAAREALAAAGGAPVAAIGVASMAETGVLLDRSGRPAVPSIAWHDTRGEAEAARLEADLGHAFGARVGLPPTPVCTLAKYRWMRDHWPEAVRGERWLNVAEWIVLGLGGDPAAELSLASRTGFYDLHARRPWTDALAWADAPPGLMSEPVAAGTAMGRCDGRLEGARDAVLTVGGHDHLAAAVGAGVASEGDVLDSCGTAEAYVQASAPLGEEAVRRAVASGLNVGWHAVDGRQAIVGAVSSGAAFEHILALLGVRPEDRAPLEAAALEIELGGAPPRLSVTGLDRESQTIGGIDRDASPAAVYHAALDAAGAAGAEILARMATVGGPARRVVVVGGWAAGDGARAVKRRHLGELSYLPATYTGAHGAAINAGRAAGVVPPDDDAAAPASAEGARA